MNAAARARAARGRNVDDTLVGKAITRFGEGLLVEGDKRALRLGRGRFERAVDPAENGVRLVVVAIAYIRLLGKAARGTAVFSDKGTSKNTSSSDLYESAA